MKLIAGLITLVMALLISGVAAYFSVVGLGALFAAAFWPVVIMGGVLEAGKIVAVTWLHANWRNKNVSPILKTYLSAAVAVLMMITALGIYGYLAKGHLEQEAPLATVEVEMQQIQQKIDQTKADRQRLDERLKQLDTAINTIIGQSKNAKETQQALAARNAQKKERDQIAKDMITKDQAINDLTQSLVPLKLKTSDVSAKLGPVKYVANLFGWNDANSAVQLVIIMIMFAFDPLAITLVLASTITIGEWAAERTKRKEERRREHDEYVERHGIGPVAQAFAARADLPAASTHPVIKRGSVGQRPLDPGSLDPVTDALIDTVQAPSPIETLKAEVAAAEAKKPSLHAFEHVEDVQPKNEAAIALMDEWIEEAKANAPEPMLDAPPPVSIPVPADEKTEKEVLMELLAKHPEVIEEMYEIAKEDTTQDDKDQANPTKVTVSAASEAIDPVNLKFWLDNPPFKKK